MPGHEVVSPRRNGWSCPWHPLQCAAWLFVGLFALLHFGILGHYIPGFWRILVFGIAAVILGVLVVAKVMATTINPAEPSVREKLPRGKFSRPKFDSAKFPHVIQNNYCTLCRVNVSRSAKHCKICDKCVENFDHHCKWLNNCVGTGNYRWFLATVWSGLAGLFLFLLFSLSLFIAYFIEEDASLLRFNCHSPSNLTVCDSSLRVLGIKLPAGANPVFPALCAICFVLSLTGLILMGHLAIFHIYLKVKGQSTYEFFVRRREDVSRDTNAQAPQPPRGRMFGGKVNRVTPVDADVGVQSPDIQCASLEMPASLLSSVHSAGSIDSVGVTTTFGRTPSPDMYGNAGSLTNLANLTDEQKLNACKSCEAIEADKVESNSMPTTESSDEKKSRDNIMMEPLPPVMPTLAGVNDMPPAGSEDFCDRSIPGEGIEETDGSSSHPVESVQQVKLDQSVLSFPLPLRATPSLSPTPMPAQPLISHPPHATPSPLPDSTSQPQSSRDCASPDSSSILMETPIPPGRNGTPIPLGSIDRTGTPVSGTPNRSLTPDRFGTPFPPDRSGTPMGSEGVGSHISTETPFHKKVSFQDLRHPHQEERPNSRPRPLPPIGSGAYHNDPLPPHARRLPPLTPLDALSLYSASSHSQLFSRPASTHSLPLPDPRYSSASRTAGELGGLEETNRVPIGHRNSSKVGRVE